MNQTIGFVIVLLFIFIAAALSRRIQGTVITNPLVPQRIRQTLNIESGLNDGIAMPFLLMAIATATAAE
jgi:sodium/hydrogen antiporter